MDRLEALYQLAILLGNEALMRVAGDLETIDRHGGSTVSMTRWKQEQKKQLEELLARLQGNES